MTDETDGGVMGKPQSNFLSQQPNQQTPQVRSEESVMEVSVASNSQLATQPWDESEDFMTQERDKTWGLLYPHCGTFPRISIEKDCYKIGRAQANDYVIKVSDMANEKLFLAISKYQCEIIRNESGTFLKDCSSNGTWLNGKKLGKNQVRPLEHDSEICFAAQNRKVYVFRSTDPQKETFPPELTDKYVVSKVLGRGACGEVRLGFRIPDNHRVAIKIINKRTTKTNSPQSVMNEVKILQKVKHPCIINLEDVVDTESFLYIVLELAEGGELFDKIIEKTKLNEKEAKLHFYQLASAIKYLHSKNICHRDLKPENVLLCSVDDTKPVVKITDMGLSKLVDLGTVLKTFVGTPNYLAPEILYTQYMNTRGSDESYSLKVDCWSLGVILYILLSGTPPFTEGRPDKTSLKDQIMKADYILYPQLFNPVSADAKDMIKKLLQPDPARRLSADEILQHSWLRDPAMMSEAEALMATQNSVLVSPILQTQRPALRHLEPPTTTTASTNSSVTITALKRLPNSESEAHPIEKKPRVELMEVDNNKDRVVVVEEDTKENITE